MFSWHDAERPISMPLSCGSDAASVATRLDEVEMLKKRVLSIEEKEAIGVLRELLPSNSLVFRTESEVTLSKGRKRLKYAEDSDASVELASENGDGTPQRTISPKNKIPRNKQRLVKKAAMQRQYTMKRKRSECHFCAELGLNCGLVAGKCPNRPCKTCKGRHRHGRCKLTKSKRTACK